MDTANSDLTGGDLVLLEAAREEYRTIERACNEVGWLFARRTHIDSRTLNQVNQYLEALRGIAHRALIVRARELARNAKAPSVRDLGDPAFTPPDPKKGMKVQP